MIQGYKSRILVLVADDDEDDCLLVVNALRKWNPAAEIRFVANGQLLMDYLNSCQANDISSTKCCPNIILLDLNMPQKSGREALREIRADARLKFIPVIIFSTSSDQADINYCHEHGANSYICKSSSFEELVEKMRAFGVYWFGTVCLPVIGPGPDSRIPTK